MADGRCDDSRFMQGCSVSAETARRVVRHGPTGRIVPSPAVTAHPLLALQRAAGNRAVTAAVQRWACCAGCATAGPCDSERPHDERADLQRAVAYEPLGGVREPQQGRRQDSLIRAAAPLLQRYPMTDDADIPSVVIEPDPSSRQRLLLRYDGALVGVLVAKRSAGDALLDLQVLDRTGSRSRGARITKIELEVIHPPGTAVVLQSDATALAAAEKRFGIGAVTLTTVERKPPYKRDRELQVWPATGDRGKQRQRREMTPGEKAAHDREEARKADDLQRAAEAKARLIEMWKILGSEREYLRQLRGAFSVNFLTRLFGKSPPSDAVWAETERLLGVAARQVADGRGYNAERTLKRAWAAFVAANARVSGATREHIRRMTAGEEVARRVGVISMMIGEEVAERIPGPVGILLKLGYEVAKGKPKDMEDAAFRGLGAARYGGGRGRSIPTSTRSGGSRHETDKVKRNPEPGVRSSKVVADGHTLKVTTTGRVVRCSVCEDLLKRYGREFDLDEKGPTPQGYRTDLERLGKEMDDPAIKEADLDIKYKQVEAIEVVLRRQRIEYLGANPGGKRRVDINEGMAGWNLELLLGRNVQPLDAADKARLGTEADFYDPVGRLTYDAYRTPAIGFRTPEQRAAASDSLERHLYGKTRIDRTFVDISDLGDAERGLLRGMVRDLARKYGRPPRAPIVWFPPP